MLFILNCYFYKEFIYEDVYKFFKDIKLNLRLVLIFCFVGLRLNYCFIIRFVYVFVFKEK